MFYIDLSPSLGKLRSPFLQENSQAETPASPVGVSVRDVHSPPVHSSVHDTPPVSPVPELGKDLPRGFMSINWKMGLCDPGDIQAVSQDTSVGHDPSFGGLQNWARQTCLFTTSR